MGGMIQWAVAVVVLMCLMNGIMVEAVQFKSKLAPTMCAAGKSVWVAATGSGPLQLQPCFTKRRVPNKNTLFTIRPSNDTSLNLLRRVNKNNREFCLTNNGGPLPALAFENPCIANATVQKWDLSRLPLVGFGKTNYCWDTLGAKQKASRITLQMCDETRPSQQWIRVN